MMKAVAREEYTRTVEPARALTLERTLSDVVNQAYVLTPAEIALSCHTAPRRMPIPAATWFAAQNPNGDHHPAQDCEAQATLG
jgi:hypothetical protein